MFGGCVEPWAFVSCGCWCFVRWEPQESLVLRVYSTRSDVYMFGTALFELVTGGEQPWRGCTPVVAGHRVISGETLEQFLPDTLHADLRSIMRDCWK